MLPRMNRRDALLATTALLSARGAAASAESRSDGSFSALAELEQREGGRLGVAALHTGNGKRLGHRENELFAMCSTFKYLLVAAVLQRVDQGREQLDRWLPCTERDLRAAKYAPVSHEHLKKGGMTVIAACSAAVEWSNSTAASLLLGLLGGPASFTSFIRTMGDPITRLDRIEPELNVVSPGDTRDTTSPAAMVNLLSTVLFGQVLSPVSRTRLRTWMLEAKVGAHRLPAGLPPGWRIAHKTGTWDSETNDVGVIWPVNRAPIVVAAFYDLRSNPDHEARGCATGRRSSGGGQPGLSAIRSWPGRSTQRRPARAQAARCSFRRAPRPEETQDARACSYPLLPDKPWEPASPRASCPR